jgi:hypothetical protein
LTKTWQSLLGEGCDDEAELNVGTCDWTERSVGGTDNDKAEHVVGDTVDDEADCVLGKADKDEDKRYWEVKLIAELLSGAVEVVVSGVLGNKAEVEVGIFRAIA